MASNVEIALVGMSLVGRDKGANLEIKGKDQKSHKTKFRIPGALDGGTLRTLTPSACVSSSKKTFGRAK